ncbi:calcium-binding protein [Shimia sagamensis]|uniref:Hemolysin-type calcium-binding repeat-containing protein n=1 Tax=Shimia sagamensis TaxID=1566352 RepID=A0ABY1NT62_9RHOB|nr:calcium-binding protein [Shimia sagamensis]SMP17505.1 Hemolysin-type calcium-binding repeat-containing protein [Shimia sagamensis]
MLALLALTAIFGVGMVADVLNDFDEPDLGASVPDDADVEAEEGEVTPKQLLDVSEAVTLSDGNDTFEGDDGSDTVTGGAGDDYLRGNNGEDWLHGAEGNDTLHGGASGDGISGGEGADYILGGAGEDTVSGGSGDDTIAMGDGNDLYDATLVEELGLEGLGFENGGNDLVRGGTGNDVLRDYEGADTLLGGTGNDTLNGSHPTLDDVSADMLGGGFGDDVLVGDNGDTLEGGEGVDEFTIAFEFDDNREEVVIADLDAATETVTFSASDFGNDAVMEWEASYDPDTQSITILLSGSHTVDGSVVTLDQEPAVILENMTADDVDLLKVTLDYAA